MQLPRFTFGRGEKASNGREANGAGGGEAVNGCGPPPRTVVTMPTPTPTCGADNDGEKTGVTSIALTTTEATTLPASPSGQVVLGDGEETIELNAVIVEDDEKSKVVVEVKDTAKQQPQPANGKKKKRKKNNKKEPSTLGSVTVNESRRKKEDNLAAIFMGFIVVFLVCHLPRLLLNIHELATIRFAMRCQHAGLNPFPMWSHLVVTISHLLLVLNSATNILIYCCLSSKFREECKKVFRKI